LHGSKKGESKKAQQDGRDRGKGGEKPEEPDTKEGRQLLGSKEAPRD